MRVRYAMATAVAAAAVVAPAGAHGPNHPAALSEATAGLAAGSATGVFAAPLAASAAGPAPTTVATILSVSDFHGRLNPTTFRIDACGEKFSGAAYLQAYLKQRAALSPTEPILVTQGDAVGATQPVSSLLGDRPTIDVMNRMGFDADTLGNHNFDDGVANMTALARQAKFPYLVANLDDPDNSDPEWWEGKLVREVDGAKVGLIGAINEDAKSLLKPGQMGDLEIEPAAPALNEAARRLHDRGVRTVVALVHFGADPTTAGPNGASGPLIELAGKLRGIDVLIGDHTYWQVNQPVLDADRKPVWVVQSVPNGIGLSEIKLTINKLDGEALGVTANQSWTTTRGVTPDPDIGSVVNNYNEQVEPLVREPIGSSTVTIPENVGVQEANQGNVVADALRAATGAQFALYNSGGLRAPLTAGDRDAAGNYLIRRGDVYGMLPFNNQLTVVEVTGTELKRMLENGVSDVPTPSAKFPQISGFSFRYTPAAPSGSRVRGATLADGKTPIQFTDGARYTLASNDFVTSGGDRYPNFGPRQQYLGDVEDAVIAYIEANSPLTPPGPPHSSADRIVVEGSSLPVKVPGVSCP